MTIAIVTLFWVCLFTVFYTYIGYGMLLFVLIKAKNIFNVNIKKEQSQASNTSLPNVTFLVAAYNEESHIARKIQNSLEFDYPKNRIQYFFVTDGSNDATVDILQQYTSHSIRVFHQNERKGKIAAVDRVMPFVDTPITIYSDANTDVNKEAIRHIVRHYQNPKVGAVAGEKRILQSEKEGASSAGEGLYWKYESQLKKWDSELYSVVGAAGELFSIKTALYETPPRDSIVEDFYMTMKIAAKGYKVVYEPGAYAAETASASVAEELKRKIRIAAGGFQSIVRLKALLNVFKYGLLSFQYISHRVLRWTLAPLSLVLLFITNALLAWQGNIFFTYFFVAQLSFYSLALLGYFLEKRALRLKIFFAPYYFCFMNYALLRGFFRYLSGQQSVLWERAKRA